MPSPSSLPLLARLDAHDRALLARFMLDGQRSRGQCRTWLALTHLGGARCAIAITLALLALPAGGIRMFERGAIALALSHMVVRIVKRRAERARPSVAMSLQALITAPDKFSFPSGHACAAMSVAITYALCFPTFAPFIVLLAFVIGASRIALGVHYPGDVLAGQLIALLAGILAFM
jgi:undecaprenyl-diphosphatase